jgi:hypothetical protein
MSWQATFVNTCPSRHHGRGDPRAGGEQLRERIYVDLGDEAGSSCTAPDVVKGARSAFATEFGHCLALQTRWQLYPEGPVCQAVHQKAMEAEMHPAGEPAATESVLPANPSIADYTESTRVDSGPVCLDRKLLLVLLFVLAGVAIAHRLGDAHFDFGEFYYAAHMILDGARHALYDLPTQHAFQAQFHRPANLTFRNPPFALIPFLPIAKLPIEVAFIIWTAISLALFFLSVRALARHAGLRYGNWPILLSLAFAPVAWNLGHGQLSFVVLSSYILTYSLWQRGRFFLGGLVLSIATFKFQLVVGFVAVLLLKRKWREVLGFTTGGAILLAISIAMTGIATLLRYPSFIRATEGDVGSEPHEMASWRGLLSLVGVDHWIVIAALSLLTVLFAARLWKDLDTGFAAAILAAMLVSYHFLLQDLSLFLIPVFLGVRLGFPKERLLPLALLALLIPETLGALGARYALLAIPLALCLWWIWQQQRLTLLRKLAVMVVGPCTP